MNNNPVIKIGNYKAKKSKIKFIKGNNKDIYAIEFISAKNNKKTKNIIWDVSAFRPDPRDYPELDSSNVIILYELITFGTNIKSFIPRYIVYEDKKEKNKNIEYFTNIR